MKLPSFYDLHRDHIPDLPPVIDFHSPRPATALDPESHRESTHGAPVAIQGALSTASQQSKPTTICSETTPSFEAQNPELETRNPEHAASSPRRWKRYARHLSRPITLTEEIGKAMYDAILRTGISDSRAGHLFHVSRATVSQWKAEDAGFADFLESARDVFAAAELRKFRDGPARNARHGVRKSMWLLEYSNPEKWGRRTRRNTAPAASESESPHPFQQSKLTTNGSETQAPTAPSPAASAAALRLGTCNLDLRTVATGDPRLEACDLDLGTSKRHKRWPGRPTLLTQEIADAMYEAILRSGISDSRAGRLSKISPATVCRWKQEDPAFAEFLEIARSKFEFAHIKKVRDTPVRSDQQGARKSKWLLENSNPERLGRRPRKLPTSTSSPRRRTPTPAAPERESSHSFQQSKVTTICSEITAAPAAPLRSEVPRSPAERRLRCWWLAGPNGASRMREKLEPTIRRRRSSTRNPEHRRAPR